MRAVVQHRYGPAGEVLRVGEFEVPAIGDDEVLVRVRASSVHADVWHVVTGRPYVLRVMGAGLRRPANPVPGTDLAGVVETVGARVTRFAPGDPVFGETHRGMQWKNGGAWAEYAAVPEDTLARKPEGIGFEEAAALPAPGYIAMLNLPVDRIEPGWRVLINGAAGALGSVVIQLLKARGAHVTGVDGPDKLDLMRALGADAVIDYTREEVPGSGGPYDLIFDVASTLSLSACKPALTRAGLYVWIGHDHYGAAAGPGSVFGSIPRAFRLMAMSSFSRHLPRVSFSMPDKRSVMAELSAALEAGTLTPVVDQTYPLEQAAEAIGRLQDGTARGRIVIVP